ncbi:MAG: peptidoglycan-binding protein [Methylobacter sp.]|nr:MAG: peptidoglycan-binding protein [Methylobacter sp.]
MKLSDQQKRLCEHVINVFESGSVEGNYAAISIYADGPHGVKQVTYGRSQTTEYGNLEELIELYVNSNGLYSAQLKPYLAKIGVTPLLDDAAFKQLLRDAAKKDPLMRKVQDEFFDKRYFQPAMAWANAGGFTQPLSALVIYDSFIHSGSIPDFLRKRFPATLPVKNGVEKDWIKQYVDTRHEWLSQHSKKILQGTIYRTQCFKNEIARDNWALAKVPIVANGVNVMN